jgi:hypothetical protein
MKETLVEDTSVKDDIDLLLLAERALLFFRKFRWIFIGAIVLGLAAGYLFYSLLPKVYKSRLVVHSFMLTNPEHISMVANWNQLLTKGGHDLLSKELNCSAALLKQVKRIKAEEIQQVFTAQNPNGFIVDVWVTNNDCLKELQAGIVFGFENAPYIKERLQVKRASLETLIATTTAEISKLDSTKKQLEAIISGRGHSSSQVLVDGSSINRQLIEMNEKLLGFKETLRFTNAVQVLQGFAPFSKPSDPKLLSWLVIGLVFFLVLAYGFALISSLLAKLKARKQPQQ